MKLKDFKHCIMCNSPIHPRDGDRLWCSAVCYMLNRDIQDPEIEHPRGIDREGVEENRKIANEIWIQLVTAYEKHKEGITKCM